MYNPEGCNYYFSSDMFWDAIPKEFTIIGNKWEGIWSQKEANLSGSGGDSAVQQQSAISFTADKAKETFYASEEKLSDSACIHIVMGQIKYMVEKEKAPYVTVLSHYMSQSVIDHLERNGFKVEELPPHGEYKIIYYKISFL